MIIISMRLPHVCITDVAHLNCSEGVTNFNIQLVVCNGLNLEFQLTGKYDKNRSIGDILGVETL